MQSMGLMKRTVLGATALAAVLLGGAAQAALQDRDLNGDKVTDAFYDTDLNITWLRDADVNGLMNWGAALAWASGYSFGGYSDWRLPTSAICVSFNCTGSEMGHLWYVELGNVAGGPMTNQGGFERLHQDNYYSSTEVNAGWAYFVAMNVGVQAHSPKELALYAMAVRNGDVPVVPEPETYALMLAGLAALAAVMRQRR